MVLRADKGDTGSHASLDHMGLESTVQSNERVLFCYMCQVKVFVLNNFPL